MGDAVEAQARQAALADWANERARFLVVGYLATDRPLLSLRHSPFYAGSMGCEASEEHLRFCAIYNETVAGLLQEQGTPAWAPASRLPDRNAVLDLLAREGRMLESLRLERPPYEHRLVESLLGRWASAKAGKPCLWCRDRERGVLVFGGDWSPKVGRVEVLDVRQMQWMASYEFLRKHVSQLPWDDTSGEP